MLPTQKKEIASLASPRGACVQTAKPRSKVIHSIIYVFITLRPGEQVVVDCWIPKHAFLTHQQHGLLHRTISELYMTIEIDWEIEKTI
jgi:hypothetical protein